MNPKIDKIVSLKIIYSIYWVLALSISLSMLFHKIISDSIFYGAYMLLCFLPSVIINVYSFYRLKRYLETKHKVIYGGMGWSNKLYNFAASEDNLGDIIVAKLKSNCMFSLTCMLGSFLVWVILGLSIDTFRTITR